MTKLQRRLALAIFTANGWSSDQPDGVAMWSLGSTRKIHSEDHREKSLASIERDIAWCRQYTGTPDECNDPARDIPRLEDLADLVRHAPVGEEWLSFEENNQLNEALYEDGVLEDGKGDPPAEARRYPHGWLAPTTDEDDLLFGYMLAALHCTGDTEGDEDADDLPLGHRYDTDDIDEQVVAKMRSRCAAFLVSNASTLETLAVWQQKGGWAPPKEFNLMQKVGYDYWKTANGVGSGFGDGDYPEDIDERLDEATGLDEMWLYAHEGKIYA